MSRKLFHFDIGKILKRLKNKLVQFNVCFATCNVFDFWNTFSSYWPKMFFFWSFEFAFWWYGFLWHGDRKTLRRDSLHRKSKLLFFFLNKITFWNPKKCSSKSWLNKSKDFAQLYENSMLTNRKMSGFSWQLATVCLKYCIKWNEDG